MPGVVVKDTRYYFAEMKKPDWERVMGENLAMAG